MKQKPDYTFPDFTQHKVAYNGRRRKVIEFLNDSPVEGFSKSDCDFLMWDGLYNGHVAQIHRKPDGSLHCDLNAHVDIEFDYPNMREAVKGLAKEIETYFKDCGI
jgi:hypothetical protein